MTRAWYYKRYQAIITFHKNFIELCISTLIARLDLIERCVDQQISLLDTMFD